MIDDALLVARIAWHLAHGIGYRFNADGPIVDAVTPLGYAHLLALWPANSPIGVYTAAKLLGAAMWVAATARLAQYAAHAGSRPLRYAPVAVMALSAPGASWAVSGLETGIVVGLCTAAVLPGRAAAWCAGLAAGWRPELIPWAIVVSFGRQVAEASSRSRRAAALAAALLPAIAVAGLRGWLFGHPAPLAVFVKPSDWQHGMYYVTAGLLWAGAPWLAFAPLGWRTLTSNERVVGAAVLAHLLTLVFAGGDWMPLFRLFVPVVPSLVYVGIGLAERGRPWASAGRLLIALITSLAVLVDRGAAARSVGPDRLALIHAARAPLANSHRIATVDAGWVGMAADAHIVDLSGATQESVAILAGGHTSKRLPVGFFERQRVDTLVLLVSGEVDARHWRGNAFARQVEVRTATITRDLPFELRAALPLAGGAMHYLILVLRERNSSVGKG